MNDLAGIGKTYRAKLSRVLEQHSGVITPAKVSSVLDVSSQESGRLLSRWHRSGWVQRVKRGMYLPIALSSTSKEPIVEEPYLIAEAIYGPGYVGGFSAVKHWDFSEQIIETVTYLSCKSVRDRAPVHAGVQFRIKTINKNKLFGFKSLWIGATKIAISDPTKTIVDLLDDPSLVGGMSIVADVLGEYMESEHYDFGLLLDYGERNGNRTVFKRLGFVLDTCFTLSESKQSALKTRISAGYSMFDTLTDSDVTNPKWRLRLSPSWKRLSDRKK